MNVKESDKNLNKTDLMKKANEWMDRAIDLDTEGKTSMSNKCLEKALVYEDASLKK